MIHIDAKEGGGQILRTAIGLSALTGKSCTIENIRAARPNPGLAEQHLQALLTIVQLTDGELAGAEIGAEKIVFTPRTINSGQLNIDIRTAGSIGLVIQTLLLPGTKENLFLKIKGGATFGKFAPPLLYLEHVFFPLLKKMNYSITTETHHNGFFPKGGARVDCTINKTTLNSLGIKEKGKIKKIRIISVATKSLKEREVAERQAKKAQELLQEKFTEDIETNIHYVDALNPGSGILIVIETENSIFGGDAIGEKKKKAEQVAEEAVNNLLFSFENGTVDIHAADMLLPYIALASGSYIAPKITNHVKTNISVIEQFLGKKFTVKGNIVSSP